MERQNAITNTFRLSALFPTVVFTLNSQLFNSQLLKMNSIIYNKSRDFAIRIINLQKYLLSQQEKVISKQVTRSGTSIGANVREGTQAQSTADFISKMSIALKEAHETDYWLDLLQATDYLSQDEYASIHSDLIELIKIITSIIITSKQHSQG